jgi:hypothetical protein
MKTTASQEPLGIHDSGSPVRPRAKTLVRLDLHNAYARLGASPLLPTDEIKELINRKRKEVMRRRRSRTEQQFGEEEAEMTRLQAIEDEIGTPKSRARYDRLNPQNALLTIQPGPHDDALDSKHRARLATAWLVEQFGRAGALPSPESLTLWSSQGIDPDLVAYLNAFTRAGERGESTHEGDESALPDIAELRRFGPGLSSQNGPPAAEEPASDPSSPEQSREGCSDG